MAALASAGESVELLLQICKLTIKWFSLMWNKIEVLNNLHPIILKKKHQIIVQSAMCKKGCTLQDASNEFMRNLEVFAEAVRFYRRVLEFASGNLKNDAKNVIKAVQKTN